MSGRVAKELYTSAEHLRREWAGMWRHVWLMAGRLADIPTPGDLLTFEIGPESVLVVRQEDGGVKAFHNVCQHRGHLLRPPGVHPGSMPIRCPYHGWTYGGDGRLRHAPHIESFEGRVCVGETSLAPVRAESFAGFAWISFAPSIEPLERYLAPVGGFLAPYKLEEWALVDDVSIELEANWKTALDAWNENYHVQGIHPQLLSAIDDTKVEIQLYERHSRLLVPFAVPSSSLSDREEIGEALAGLISSAGLDPASFAGRASEVRGALIEAGRADAAARNLDVAGLSAEQLVDAHNFHVFPNVTLVCWYSRALLYRFCPHATDPNRCVVDYQIYERPARGPRARHERFRYGDRKIDMVMKQDLDAVVGVQRGMLSEGFVGPELGRLERRIRFVHEVIDRYLSALPRVDR